MKILGDRELLIRLKQTEIKEFFQVNEVIAQYDLGGISGNPKNALLVFKESLVLHLIYEKLNVFKTVSIRKDLSGLDRIVRGEKNG